MKNRATKLTALIGPALYGIATCLAATAIASVAMEIASPAHAQRSDDRAPPADRRERGPGSLDEILKDLPKAAPRPGDPAAPGGPNPGKRADPKSADPKSSLDPKSTDPKSKGKAAEADKEPKPIPRSMRRPGGTSVPEGASHRAALLTELYAYLATATDEDVAKRTANAIEHVWQAGNTDTVNLLIERAQRAAKEKKYPLAVKIFEQAAGLAPDNPDVFVRRALIHYGEGDMSGAVGDLRRALALDPNNYRALEALAQIFKELERKKAALAVYRRLYEVHPFFSGAKSALDELAREVEGQAG
jgi:tetratricopeptide (TPR) repeat protein